MKIIFSVIIPFKGSLRLLERLLDTIPEQEEIEVLIVDNNGTIGRLASDYFAARANLHLLYSDPLKGAGHARNIGLQVAKGEWILFADADDFFHPGAFEIFYSCRNSPADIIYFCADSCYSDSLRPAQRGERVTELVTGYNEKKYKSELRLRYKFLIPSCKMIKRKFIEYYRIRFEEIQVANDVYFSVVAGFWAKKIQAVPRVVYCLTVAPGSLTTLQSKEFLRIKYTTRLKSNVFLKQQGFSEYRLILIFHILKALKYGWRTVQEFCNLAHEKGMSIWVGWKELPAEVYYRIKKKIFRG